MSYQAAEGPSGAQHAFRPGKRQTACGTLPVVLSASDATDASVAVSLARRFDPEREHTCGRCKRVAA